MEPKSVQLRPDWGLLDSTFESYKLSLQQLPIYPLDLDCKVDSVTVGDNEFSYNRTKTLSLHSYLFGDPWCEKDCYFVDSMGRIKRVTVIVETAVQSPSSVFQLDPHFLQNERHTPVTISFPSPTVCLVCDGAGLMYLLHTGDRQNGPKKWETILTEEIAGNSSSPPMLLHSRSRIVSQVEGGDGMAEGKDVIDVLTLRFEDDNKDGTTVTLALMEWTTLSQPDKSAKYSVDGHRLFKGKQAPFYAAFGDSPDELFIAAHTLISYVPDWNQQLLIDEMEIDTAATTDENMDAADESNGYAYEWKQTSEDITAYFLLPDGTTKSQIIYNLSKDALSLGLQGTGETRSLLQGKLFAAVDPEASSWVIADGRLEVTVQKDVLGQTWPCVVVGDASGKRLLSEENVSASATELQEMDDARGSQPGGLEPYEECDDLPDVESMLYRFDSAVNKFTHEASIASNQWLFNCLHYGRLCTVLRHDVDALIWEAKTPTEAAPEPWKHVATFNALGYVRASKEDLKYSGASPTASYAALCESYRRIFVYHCPTKSKTPLRNRTTGKDVHVSKQQVVTLPSGDPILGFHATSKHMFALTESKLFIIKVATPET